MHSEAQEIVRIFKYPNSPFEVHVNPHPDADDVRETSSSFEQRNVGVVHVAGHTAHGEVPAPKALQDLFVYVGELIRPNQRPRVARATLNYSRYKDCPAQSPSTCKIFPVQ